MSVLITTNLTSPALLGCAIVALENLSFFLDGALSVEPEQRKRLMQVHPEQLPPTLRSTHG